MLEQEEPRKIVDGGEVYAIGSELLDALLPPKDPFCQPLSGLALELAFAEELSQVLPSALMRLRR